jgi:Dullard-like phosphatase family protein
MLQFMRFCPLLNDGSDVDSPWPAQDPYERFGAERFANDGPIIWFEPLPPMMADLDKVPKLPPLQPAAGEVYTLVLDLDETLVHYFEQNGLGNYGIRPGMFEFLQRMNELRYEIVIFTAATQDYADWVIDQIDPGNLIHYRLYRQHALPWGPLFAKDLRCLGRDLERTLIIDNVQENFMMQPNNGIFIATWYDDPQDQALYELVPLLEELITTRAKVPEILNKYRDQIPRWAGFERFWDSDGGLEPPLDIAPQPQIEAPPQPQPTPQRNVAPASTGPAYASATQPGMAPPEPARVLGTSPHHMQATSPAMANSTTTGYPDATQQQQWASQASVPKKASQPVQRQAATYSGIAGPYQSAPPMPVRQAFSGIAGPYQAALSRPAGRQ